MRYEWDEAKRQANLRKHGIDFAEIERVFAGPTFTIWDDRFEYDEPRFLTFGLLRDRAMCEKLRGANSADALYSLLTGGATG